MGMQANSGRPRIVVLGGGFGGLEAAFYLRMRLGDRARITLVSDRDRFLFKPNTIYIPFGLDPERLMIPLAEPARRKAIALIVSPVREIDPARQEVRVDGQTIPYDYLVVATGAGMRPEEIPGLAEHACTIWTPEEMLRLRAGIQKLVEKAREGQSQEVLFVVPPNNKCSGPLYEIVFMLDTWLRRQGVRSRVSITYTTYEQGFIQAFGPRLHTVVTEEFSRRGITGHTRYVVERVEPGRVFYRNGEVLTYDLLISFPPYVAAASFPSLPADDRGFIQTVLETRQVVGHPNIYAVGDAADFPVKQAFLALLQGDTAAEQIAARVLGHEPKLHFEPTSMCVMEQFDKATFAQVPLRVTGRPDLPVEVREDAVGLYKVGSSGLWRLGKTLLGIYLPWRFRNGEPFHAGLPWEGMELGLKVMSAVLAR
jgi:NADH dehydrogenase FAD-containing subunit